ncbi:hypothetical protein E4L96_18975 [Massilia arenosa]|uniref:DUF1579 domain-containing protein n=1 Tax=Zemynaea arenosa TaxID=2561931 RepID=A0A4Y9RX81_9BURK|nr:hypothetical protein [Massilia arenosa]TFW13887.1 hypothetical protein E4L96_18975 [Massilia arenosa]
MSGRSWLAAAALLCLHGWALAAPPRDGSHDFDFDLGTWHTHTTRLVQPLSGAAEWREMDGLTIVRPLFGGRGNVAEYRAAGSAGAVELVALRLYHPQSGQWSIHFATPGVGVLGTPYGTGGARAGRVEFYDQEEFAGRQILVRFAIWSTGQDTAQSEQAFSADGGQTWETNWINRYTRSADGPPVKLPPP